MARPIKRTHEFRDPIHDFIELDRQQRALVDSEPFQRLRQIHQLAVTSLVYPGASHKRFEHSLGVMQLARRVFNIVTHPKNVRAEIEHIIPDGHNLDYWRTVICLAALCHDLGHLPFSHAAEKQLLPKGEDHESLTIALIDSPELAPIFKEGARVERDDVKKLAVGKKKLKNIAFSDWEAILSEIITGDSFGVDRIDYLLRDSYHLGVSYGRFDHQKLIESLRILPQSTDADGSREPALGVEFGGVHSAEALLLARYFMYEQVYFHHVRLIYDTHLIEFLQALYGTNGYPLNLAFHLSQTDNEVMVRMREAARDPDAPGHAAAKALLCRGHYKMVYNKNPTDDHRLESAIESGKVIPNSDGATLSAAGFLYGAMQRDVPVKDLRLYSYQQKSNPNFFPVAMPDGRIEASVEVSPILANIPLTAIDYIFAARPVAQEAVTWIERNRDKVLEGAWQ